MRVIIVTILVFSFILLNGCSNNEAAATLLIDDIKHSMAEANVHYEEVVHIEVVQAGFLVFYRDGEGLNVGFIKNEPKNHKWKVLSMDYNNLNPEKGLSWSANNKEDIPLYFFYGVITNPNITRVITKKPDGSSKQSAKIITTDSGLTFWFTLYDEPTSAPMDVIGLDKDSNIIVQ